MSALSWRGTLTNENMHRARAVKNDEFYTQYPDIEREMNAYLDYDPDVFRGRTVLLPCDDPEWSNFTRYFAQNFRRLGLRKLISTSYAPRSKPQLDLLSYLPSELERVSPEFDAEKALSRGKIFTLVAGEDPEEPIDIRNLRWRYLEGDGDFRSPEVTALRDEADIIITNPPFSLFREYMDWVMAGEKRFVVIANKNCVTYREIFPLIKENRMWSGREPWSGGMWFRTTDTEAADKIIDETPMRNVSSIWLTNIDHGRRHQPFDLMSMADNLRFNPNMRGRTAYDRYDNYDAIEVPFTNAIPSDYDGAMGVPISFLDKYCPEQFEILGIDRYIEGNSTPNKRFMISGKEVYARIVIRRLS